MSSALSASAHGSRVVHRAALDIDGAFQLAGHLQRLADLRQVAPDLHDHRRIGVGEPPGQFGLAHRAGQDGQNIVALHQRQAGLRPAAGHGGDAGDHLGRKARGKPHMQVHVGAVEQRIAFAQHRHRAARIEMRGDRAAPTAS